MKISSRHPPQGTSVQPPAPRLVSACAFPETKTGVVACGAGGWTPITPVHDLGEDAYKAVQHALLAHHRKALGTRRIAGPTSSNGDEVQSWETDQDCWLLWNGNIWDADKKANNPGRYFIPALYDGGKLRHDRQAIRDLASNGKQLGSGNVAFNFCAFAEMDDVPLDEQRRRLTALADRTGLPWTLWVSSGGKSIHAYWAFNRLILKDDPLRLAIQQALVAVLAADHHITESGRKMRLPGWSEPGRIQRVLHLDASARYDPAVILTRLQMVAKGMGIRSIQTAFHDVKLAWTLNKDMNALIKAGIPVGNLPDRVREGQALLIEQRGRSSDTHPVIQSIREDQHRLLGRALREGREVSVQISGIRMEVGDELNIFRHLPHLRRVVAPCCLGRTDLAAAVIAPEGRFLGVFCHRHEFIRIREDLPDGVILLSSQEVADLEPEWRQNAAAVRASRLDASRASRMEAARTTILDRASSRDAVEAKVAVMAAVKPLLKRLNGLADEFRSLWIKAGIKQPSDMEGCAFYQGLVKRNADLSAERILAGRMCHRPECYVCGPRKLALQALSIAGMPLIHNDRIVGRAFFDRPLWRYDIAPSDLPKFQNRFVRAAESAPESALTNSTYNADSGALSEIQREGHGWTAIHNTIECTVISTLRIPISNQRSGRWMPDPTPVPSWDGLEDWLRIVVDLLKARVEIKIDMFAPSGVSILSKIRSSKLMTHDPLEIVRRASSHKATVEAEHVVGPRVAGPILTQEQIPWSSRSLQGDTRITGSLQMQEDMTDEAAQAMWEKLTPGNQSPPVIDLDETETSVSIVVQSHRPIGRWTRPVRTTPPVLQTNDQLQTTRIEIQELIDSMENLDDGLHGIHVSD